MTSAADAVPGVVAVLTVVATGWVFAYLRRRVAETREAIEETREKLKKWRPAAGDNKDAWNRYYARYTTVLLVVLASKPRENEIVKPAGTTFLAFVSIIFTPKTVKEVFAQEVADMRQDEIEALAAGEPTRWIGIRGNCWLWISLVALIWVRIGKMIYTLWKAT